MFQHLLTTLEFQFNQQYGDFEMGKNQDASSFSTRSRACRSSVVLLGPLVVTNPLVFGFSNWLIVGRKRPKHKRVRQVNNIFVCEISDFLTF